MYVNSWFQYSVILMQRNIYVTLIVYQKYKYTSLSKKDTCKNYYLLNNYYWYFEKIENNSDL